MFSHPEIVSGRCILLGNNVNVLATTYELYTCSIVNIKWVSTVHRRTVCSNDISSGFEYSEIINVLFVCKQCLQRLYAVNCITFSAHLLGQTSLQPVVIYSSFTLLF